MAMKHYVLLYCANSDTDMVILDLQKEKKHVLTLDGTLVQEDTVQDTLSSPLPLIYFVQVPLVTFTFLQL